MPDHLDLKPLQPEGAVDLNAQVARIVTLEGEIPRLKDDIARYEREQANVRARIPVAERELARARRKLDLFGQLSRQVRFYDGRARFGASFSREVGFAGNVPPEWNDRIASIGVGDAAQVRVYEHYGFQGRSLLVTKSLSVPPEFVNNISSIRVEENAETKTNRLRMRDRARNLEAELARLRTEIPRLERRVREAREKIERTAMELEAARRRSMGDVALPMPLVHLDPMGLHTTGASLDFAEPGGDPCLLDSAIGKLALYFPGRKDQAFVAYYDTMAARAHLALPESNLAFTARAAGALLAETTVHLEAEGSTESCTLHLENIALGVTETWRRLPRDAAALAAVLNGQAADRVFIGDLAEPLGSAPGDTTARAAITEIRLRAPLRRSLGLGASLSLSGMADVTLRAPAASGDTVVQIEETAMDLAVPEGTSVYAVAYDYARYARTSRPTYPLRLGSLFVRASAPAAGGHVEPTGAPRPLEGPAYGPRWVADPPGNTISFRDGLLLRQAGDLATFDVDGDVTLEAWLNPDEVEPRTRLVEHRSPRGRYVLGLEPESLSTALALEESGGHFEIPGIDLRERSFTIEFWFKRDRPNVERLEYFLGQGVLRPVEGLLVGFRASNELIFSVWQEDLLTQPFPDTEWHHWACVFDAVTMEQTIYRDGQAVARRTARRRYRGHGPLHVGRSLGLPVSVGRIDELRVFASARSQQEIREHMAGRLHGNEPDLLGAWHFANGAAHDYSGGGRDGRRVGQLRSVSTWLFGLPRGGRRRTHLRPQHRSFPRAKVAAPRRHLRRRLCPSLRRARELPRRRHRAEPKPRLDVRGDRSPRLARPHPWAPLEGHAGGRRARGAHPPRALRRSRGASRLRV